MEGSQIYTIKLYGEKSNKLEGIGLDRINSIISRSGDDFKNSMIKAYRNAKKNRSKT